MGAVDGAVVGEDVGAVDASGLDWVVGSGVEDLAHIAPSHPFFSSSLLLSFHS